MIVIVIAFVTYVHINCRFVVQEEKKNCLIVSIYNQQISQLNMLKTDLT